MWLPAGGRSDPTGVVGIEPSDRSNDGRVRHVAREASRGNELRMADDEDGHVVGDGAVAEVAGCFHQTLGQHIDPGGGVASDD